MKITRALLLSSKKQAEAWEYAKGGIFARKAYRYLVEEREGGSLRFCIFCVHQEPEEGTTRTRDVVADRPHVERSFDATGDLLTFLHRYQIDMQESWQPVED